ncbi:TetR/AcrR family transcriptional regulator [Cognatiyoonia koreensis]|nr:TetR/AcrR family transcriptional regulator [Cognatiyoonia koreensis]
MNKPVLHRDDPALVPLTGNVKVTRQDWLNAALDVLVNNGASQVKILTLADRMGVSRSSFYWYFKSRADLLDALLDHWQSRNTDALIRQSALPATTITAAVCNVFHCVLDARLFDARLDFAIRDWSRRSDKVRRVLDHSDRRRVDALAAMFARFGFPDAVVRARVLYYMQTGYDDATLAESLEERIAQVPAYLYVFTGQHPQPGEVEALAAYARAASDDE